MDKKFSNIFDNWSVYTEKMNKLYERLEVLFTDLGMNKSDIKITAFISSLWLNEIKFYDSNNISHISSEYIKTKKKDIAEKHLSELFNFNLEQSVFTFDTNSLDVNVYDEFGLLPETFEDICFYGIAIQYPQIKYSKIIYELLLQISIYCRAVLDNKNFELEEYKLMDIVLSSLRTYIDIDLYNTLAASYYEKRVASGGILIVDETKKYNLTVSFKKQYPQNIKNVREIRKLLEMSSDGSFLIAKDDHIIGIGDSEAKCDLFQFSGHQMWSYGSDDKELLIYNKGRYTFISDTNKDFILYLPKNFIDAQHVKHLNDILNEIKKQKNGSTLIISDEASAEVERLCSMGRGYSINPIDLKLPCNRKLLSNITSIDGSVFIDTNFLCYGIGIILDGIAVQEGLSSRGARYNSAKCYIDNKDFEKFIAVVFSEDETIDFIYNKK